MTDSHIAQVLCLASSILECGANQSHSNRASKYILGSVGTDLHVLFDEWDKELIEKKQVSGKM